MPSDRRPQQDESPANGSLREGQLAVLVGHRVGDALGRFELVELVPLAADPDRRLVLGEVDVVALPAQLPGDDDVDHRRHRIGRMDRDVGQAERAADAGDRSWVL